MVAGGAVVACRGQKLTRAKPTPPKPVYALATFSSVFLVTVTVTRKMVTMMLSVVAFGHRLTRMQWLGVALVFGGIGVEARIARREKMAKAREKEGRRGGAGAEKKAL